MKYLIYILLILGIGGCENDRQLYDGEVNDVSGIYFRYFSRTLKFGRIHFCLVFRIYCRT